MVFGEGGVAFSEGDDAAGGEQAGLTPASAEPFTDEAGALDELFGTEEDAPDGGSETFAETDAGAIEGGGEGFDFAAEANGGVHNAGTIEMKGRAVFGSEGAGDGDGFWADALAAVPVVGVFEAEDSGVRSVVAPLPEGGFEFVGGGVDAAESEGEKTRKGGRSAGFVVEDVAVLFGGERVSGLGVDVEGDLIAEGAAGAEEGGFEAEGLGRELLELEDGGVVAENVVTEGRAGHGRVHGGGGTRNGVAPEVNHWGKV